MGVVAEEETFEGQLDKFGVRSKLRGIGRCFEPGRVPEGAKAVDAVESVLIRVCVEMRPWP